MMVEPLGVIWSIAAFSFDGSVVRNVTGVLMQSMFCVNNRVIGLTVVVSLPFFSVVTILSN